MSGSAFNPHHAADDLIARSVLDDSERALLLKSLAHGYLISASATRNFVFRLVALIIGGPSLCCAIPNRAACNRICHKRLFGRFHATWPRSHTGRCDSSKTDAYSASAMIVTDNCRKDTCSSTLHFATSSATVAAADLSVGSSALIIFLI